MSQQLIDKYQLEPHPEGGFYRQIYAAEHQVISPVNGKQRHASTHIYFLLPIGHISRFHQVDHDEIWHHYSGAPLTLIRYDNDRIWETTLGGNDGEYVAVVRGGTFQAAESAGEYSLVGCTVSPGFDFKDFTFVDDVKSQSNIINNYPNYQRFL